MGAPSTTIVKSIVDAAKVRALALLDTKFKLLPYTKEYQKNASNIGWGYGFNVLDASPGDTQVLGSYCLTLNLELVLIASIVKKDSERAIEAALYELQGWAAQAARDFRASRLGIPNTVLKVGDHSIPAPEYFSDATQIALRPIYPVTFRESLH